MTLPKQDQMSTDTHAEHVGALTPMGDHLARLRGWLRDPESMLRTDKEFASANWGSEVKEKLVDLISAALSSRPAPAVDKRSTLERGDEIEADFYRLKGQEWACEPNDARQRVLRALAPAAPDAGRVTDALDPHTVEECEKVAKTYVSKNISNQAAHGVASAIRSLLTEKAAETI